MAAFAARRPTRDIDLRASGFPNDVAECERRIRDIVAVQLVDGLSFDPSSVRGEAIRDESDYTGVRVHLEATLASARITIHVDINFGDPIWPAPEPTQLPRLLGGFVLLLGYPDHMVLAEKIVTAIQRGVANTRWRDFVDIESITRHRAIAADDLSRALTTVADHRQANLRSLAEALEGMAETAQPKWLAWRRRQRHGRHDTRALPGPARSLRHVRRPCAVRRRTRADLEPGNSSLVVASAARPCRSRGPTRPLRG